MTYDVIILTCMSGNILQRGIGAYQVADHLRRNNFSVQVIDFTDYFSEKELISAVEHFIGNNTIAIGVSSTFYRGQAISGGNVTVSEKDKDHDFLPTNTVQTLKFLKEKYKEIKFLLGGASSYKCSNNSIFDFSFQGYSEAAVVDYLANSRRIWPTINGLSKIDGSQFTFNVDSLEHKWADNDLIFKNETLPIEISRGCIFKCKFCNYPLNGKKKFDYLRSADVIKKELIDNYERFGTTRYLFGDDTFNDSTYKLEQLHKIINNLPFKIEFATYLRLDLLHAHREQIQLLKEMGLGNAFFGIESMNERTARLIGKGMPPEKVKEFLLELQYDLWKDEVFIECSFIVGLPFEDKVSTDKTFQWLTDNKITNFWNDLGLEPGKPYQSEFDKNFEKYGYKVTPGTTKNTWYWENDIMNAHEAFKIAEEYNSQSLPNQPVPSFFLFPLLSTGLFDRKELAGIKGKDLPKDLIAIKTQEMVLEYKSRLLKC
jgi:hypothetical protein